MSDIKININTQGGAYIAGGEFHGTEFVANKYVYINDKVSNPKYDDIEDAVEVSAEEQAKELVNPYAQQATESVKVCFRIANNYVREQVEAIVNEFYLGEHVNLAMIEVTLFDHGQLKKRNEHTTFVRALKDWGILSSDVDVAKAASGMASKLRSPFPTEGYKQWDKNYLNERKLCTNIGNRLPVSMKYNRNE